MGYSQSKLVLSDNAIKRKKAGHGVKVHCVLGLAMVNTLRIPPFLVELFSLRKEKYLFLFSGGGNLYVCEMQTFREETFITKGWDQFLAGTGTQVRDYLVFDIAGSENIFVTVFRPDGSERCHGDDSPTSVPNGNDGASSSGIPDQMRTPEVMLAPDHLTTTPVDSAEGGVFSQPQITPTTVEIEGGTGYQRDVSLLVEQWRPYFTVAKDVHLYNWMIEFVGSGLGWTAPLCGIYVGRVDMSSLKSNRLRLPREFTTKYVVPNLKDAREKIFLKCRTDDRIIVRFCIEKDGRAAFTSGWTAFALANDIKPGSIVAFIFGTCHTGVDIEIDVLTRT